MSRGINKSILVGNLGADPEYKVLRGGTPLATFSIATNEYWKDRTTGENREKTEWHPIAVYGPLAEVAKQYLRKGNQVYIEGKLRHQRWEDDRGNKHNKSQVVVDHDGIMQMLGGGQNAQGNQPSAGHQQSAPQSQAKDPAQPEWSEGFDDDQPF